MTETIDIKALRERLVELNRTYALISSVPTRKWADDAAHSFIKSGGVNLVLEQLDQLEAERQRADDEKALNKHLDLANRASEGVNASLRRQVEKAEKELAALRGTQEPDDTMAHMMPNVFASLVNTARDVAIEYKNAQCLREALSRELKGYFTLTRPPKPVMVLSFDQWCESRGEKPLGWVRDAMKEAYSGALEAAGIVVKDGE